MPPRRAASSKTGRAVPARSKAKPATSIAFEEPEQPLASALPPARVHPRSYHFPLLSDDKKQHVALLDWFKSVEDTRTMPWRKAWIDRTQFPGSDEEAAHAVNRRAYEVWVSEVSKSANVLDGTKHVEARRHVRNSSSPESNVLTSYQCFSRLVYLL